MGITHLAAYADSQEFRAAVAREAAIRKEAEPFYEKAYGHYTKGLLTTSEYATMVADIYRVAAEHVDVR